MKLKFITLLSAMLINFLCFGQDILTYKNGTETKSKVIEVTSSEVKFKRFDNLNGPLYTVLKSDLFMIKYENGTKEVFSVQTNTETVSGNNAQETKEEVGYKRMRYNGPRAGITFFGEGTAKDRLTDKDYAPMIIQFGWQFETRLFTLDNGTAGLVEWVLLVGGIEKGLFLPSATMIVGVRGGKGFEFGLGPNLSISGIGMAFAVGGSFQSGRMVFPINLAIVPSVNNRLNDDEERLPTGLRVSLLVGFSTRTR